jgi:uncharacterized protein YoaH (UPF0181 family)
VGSHIQELDLSANGISDTAAIASLADSLKVRY